MNIREIKIQFPSLDHKEAVANILIVKTEATQEEEKFVIKDFKPFHHTFLVIECNSEESVITFNTTKQINLQVMKGVSIINLYDLSDFTYKKEDDLEFWFDNGFEGSVYAVSRYGGFCIMTTNLERIEYELKLAGFKLKPVPEDNWSDDDTFQHQVQALFEEG